MTKVNIPFKWKVKHEVSFREDRDFLSTILNSLGIYNIKDFLNPTEKHTFDPFLLEDMEKGIELLKSSLNKKVFIKVDPDVDGFTSAAYMRQFIQDIAPDTNIVYKLDYNKRHGLYYRDVEDIEDLALIIVPDASGDYNEIEKVLNIKNVPVLIIDHHDFSEEMDKISKITTLINCKRGTYPNGFLSGVGVVHKFCLAYCQRNNLSADIANKYLDLVALGMIADAMDLRDLETRYYVLEGLKPHNFNNELLKEMRIAFQEDLKPNPTILDTGWVIAPKINGCVRYGKDEEQVNLFRAISGEQENIVYQPRRKSKNDPQPPKEIHSLQKTMARVCGNVKSRQDTEVRKFMTSLEEIIEDNHLDENSIILLDGTEIVTKDTVTGLVANKIASKYQRPTVILKKRNNELFGGSGRGFGQGKIENFKSFLLNLGLFEDCAGHEGAFGVSIKTENVSKVTEACNELISKEDLEPLYEVDYEIEANNLSEEQVKEIALYNFVWGNTVPEPQFLIKNVRINAKDISVFGDNDGFIRFLYNGVRYIKKYCKRGEYDEITLNDGIGFGGSKKDLTIDVICQAQENTWQDKAYYEMKILKFYSRERTSQDDEVEEVLLW